MPLLARLTYFEAYCKMEQKREDSKMYAYLGSTDILLYDVFTVYISSLALLVYNLAQIKEKRGFSANSSE